jgi:glycosyltransferase involved in cell wall biosynthesis
MMRVLHLPTAVGGGPAGLSAQLRRIGVDSEVWTIDKNYLDYPVDRVLTDADDPIIVQMLKVLRAGTYVFGRWDVIHYNYGSTLFSNGGRLLAMRGTDVAASQAARLLTAALGGVAGMLQRMELGILRLRKIPVFVHYQGDDARQGDYSLEHFEFSIASQVPPGYYTPRSDKWRRRQIALMSRHAAGIYAVNPDLLNVLPPSAEFVPYGHIAIQEWEPHFTQAHPGPLVFAHAPSNRSVKGTDLILEAIEELRAEGHVVEVDLIEGVSNAEALARYAKADVVIDQLYAGWYGGVAVEAMALGKPVVGYLRESDLQFLPPGMERDLPLFRATPATIKDVLRGIVEMPRTELVARAQASRAFVERWHDPAAITSKIADDYRRARESSKRMNGAR